MRLLPRHPRPVAESFGVAPALVEALVTLTPARVRPADVDAAYEAGWDDEAIYTAVSVAAVFNAMNRIVDGLGITADEDFRAASAARLADRGYALLPPR